MYSLLNRPKAVLSIATALLLAGFWTATRLPLEWSPQIELPVIRIAASWPGASPRSVERHVTAPIERAVQSVQGVASVESISEEGRTTVSLDVSEDADLSTFIAEINDRLIRLHPSLPDRVHPQLTKDIPEALRDEQGFMTLQLVGPLTPEALRQLAEKEVAPRLRSLQGLAEVAVRGGAGQELRITLDAARLAALRIEPEVIRQRLSRVLSDDVYGRLRESGRATLMLHAAATEIEALRRLPIREQEADRPPVRLQDVAKVRVAAAPVYSISRVDGQPVVTLILSRARGSHMIQTSTAVRERLEALQDNLPDEVRLEVTDDRTDGVRAQLRDLAVRGGMGFMLVLLVLLFMLKSIRAAVIVMYAVMVSLAIAFMLLALFELTLNLLVIAGLVLVFGLLVDNSVVIVEQLQIQQKRLTATAFENDDDRWRVVTQRALEAVWLPLLGGTLSTMAVLLPLVYLSGDLRALFLPFGMMVSMTLGASLISAALLMPVMMRVMPLPVEPVWHRSKKWRRITAFPYRVAARLPRLTLLVLLLALGLPIGLIPNTIEMPDEGWSRPKMRMAELYNATIGSAPLQTAIRATEPYLGGVLRPFSKSVVFGPAWGYQQTPEVSVRLGFPTGNPIARADTLIAQFEQIALASSAVSRTIAQVSERQAMMRVQFYEPALLTSEPYAVREGLIQRAVLLGGVSVSVGGLLPEGYYSGSGGNSSGFTVEAFGPNYEDLEVLSDQFAARLKQASRRVFEVDINAGRYGWAEEREVVHIEWGADAAARTRLSSSDVAAHLRPVLNTRFPFQYADLEGLSRLPIRMLVDGSDQLDIASLIEQPLTMRDSIAVKLANASSLSIEKTPARIERKNQQYRRFIRVDFRGPFQMGSEFIEQHLDAMPLPAGYSLSRHSFSFFNAEVAASYFWVILGTLLLVFLVTACVLESWWLPFVVICSVPLALIGLALGFFWSGANFAEGAFIGSVLLIGIAVNDSILLIDRYRKLQTLRPGASSSILVRIAVRDRLRPMWTTTLTSIVAMLPLLVFPDSGDFWMGLAVTVVGGLLASTLLSPLATVAMLAWKK